MVVLRPSTPLTLKVNGQRGNSRTERIGNQRPPYPQAILLLRALLQLPGWLSRTASKSSAGNAPRFHDRLADLLKGISQSVSQNHQVQTPGNAQDFSSASDVWPSLQFNMASPAIMKGLKIIAHLSPALVSKTKNGLVISAVGRTFWLNRFCVWVLPSYGLMTIITNF